MDQPVKDMEFCKIYLQKVSRTFAVNIEVLRGNPYKGMLLGYLLCRIADTIEDDPHFSSHYKIRKLNEFSELFPPHDSFSYNIERFLRDIEFQHHNDETVLLLNLLRVFNEFRKLPQPMVSLISAHVKEMALGMAEFQQKDMGNGIVFLEDRQELERYCYFVAGTVGLMITSIFSENSRRITPGIKQKLEDRSVAFGLGLQITNIAKDFFGDQKRGWCYVPRTFFSAEGIEPLRDSFHLKPDAYLNVHKQIIAMAMGYLEEALQYTLTIPRTLIRYRLFCLWPLFMAVETLGKLYDNPNLYSSQNVKIGRDDVRRIVRNTSIAVMSNHKLESMFRQISGKIRQ